MRRTSGILGAALLSAALGCGASEPPPTESAPSAASVESPRPQPPAWPAWGAVAWPGRDEALEIALRQAELERDPTAEAIDRAWQHDDAAWRARAALTLGRIGGAAARERLAAALGRGDVELDAASLAAIALLEAPNADDPRDEGWDVLEDRLWTRYAVTEDPADASALLLALARIGGPRSPARLTVDLSVAPSPGEEMRHVHAMEALAISCVRGHALPPAALQVLSDGLSSPRPELQAASAFALARCAAVSAEQLAGEVRGELVARLATVVQHHDPVVARRGWWAFEALGELPRVVPAGVLGAEPMDWMTEVAAVRALAAHADGRKVLARRIPTLSLDGFVGPRLHVLRDLLERLRPFVANEPELEAPIDGLASSLGQERARASKDPGRAKVLTLLGCEAQLLLATRSGQLGSLRTCALGVLGVPEAHGERMVVEALVNMGPVMMSTQRAAALIERAGHADPSIAASAAGALAGVDDPGVNPALRAALARDDMGIVAAAAGSIGSRASDRTRRDPEAAPLLLDAVHRFDDAKAVETRISALDALGRLARSASTEAGAAEPAPAWLDEQIVPLARDPATAVRTAARRALRGHADLLARFDAAVPANFTDGFAPTVHQAVERFAGRVEGLRLHTERGAITIDFTGAPAPIAQANLAALAEAGFFDGITVHRVVPGFVIQGGDPRGDGYGGPGHLLPCEWSPLRYERGTVGIALAGKDTGGSQLFITHDATRHLDARYTVVGRVVEGMDVVDATWPYDRIERVEWLESVPTPSPSP